MRVRSVVVGLTLVALFGAALAVLTALLAHFTLLTGPVGSGGQTAINQWLALVAAVTSISLFAVLVVIGVDDQSAGAKFSPLYWPFLFTKAFLAAVLSMIGVTALDFVLHGPNLHWRFMLDPEVRVLLSLLFLALSVSLGWQMVIILLGRVRDRRSQ